MQGTSCLRDFQSGLTILTPLVIFTIFQHSLTVPYHHHIYFFNAKCPFLNFAKLTELFLAPTAWEVQGS